ncbi:BlaR1 peptidase M56 [Robiginitalea myxolifaciens]|uniref:BlaR1 peptidase M56 n=1 Tax=Robiginitalea myxolifaciens TaxID=400055 RepID=A0A1I6FUQ4_9FLAO|nr:M56 family metallopeptidase [Robiginitalea myxolifaciens]SFR33641.1 BlaR1 peptidase M56 [Robiginitalea myxolifaciens]
MIEYLIKSSACLLIFFLFYRLVLERQSNHVFKRFYLLGSLLAGLGIPLLILGETVIALAPDSESLVGALPDPEIGDALLTTSPGENGKILTNEYLLNPDFWEAFYFIGLLIFGAYFIWNLSFLLHKIYGNKRLRETTHTKVLLEQPEPPHTFLRFLFLGQQAYADKNIPESVLQHEQTHIDEKHSLDVLLAEFLRLIFWFHPLVWAYCRAIRLNHEFLADRKVIAKGYSALEYQHALLAFAQNSNQPALSHAIHYSSIKKRIQIMKTNTSKRRNKLALLLLTPIIALTVLSFSSRKITYQPVPDESISLEYLSPDALRWNGSDYTPEAAAKLVKETAGEAASVLITAPHEITAAATQRIGSAFQAAGIDQIQINADTYRMPVQEYSDQVATESAGVLMRANRLVLEEEEPIAVQQESATREEMKIYNGLAKKYNAMIAKGKVQVYMKEVERMMYIYNKMSEKQRADAEPFPDFPDPPPPPPTPTPSPQATKMATPPPPPPPAPGAVSGSAPSPKLPPPPPPPPTMEEILAKLKASGMENTTFYFNGKALNKKDAIRIMEDGKASSVSIQTKNDGSTVVKLSN